MERTRLGVRQASILPSATAVHTGDAPPSHPCRETGRRLLVIVGATSPRSLKLGKAQFR